MPPRLGSFFSRAGIWPVFLLSIESCSPPPSGSFLFATLFRAFAT